MDWNKVKASALISSAAATGIYFLQQFDSIDFGRYDILATALAAFLIAQLREFITRNDAVSE